MVVVFSSQLLVDFSVPPTAQGDLGTNNTVLNTLPKAFYTRAETKSSAHNPTGGLQHTSLKKRWVVCLVQNTWY